jgi:predicted helicase
MMTFTDILNKYRSNSFSEKDKGERFERLMQGYLKTDPQYSNQFKEVWMWNDFPFKGSLGGFDTGIDLVALTNSGEYWAIQCKCYQESTTIDKPAVDSFLSTSSRGFVGENSEEIRFSHRMWISTTNNWGTNSLEALNNQNPPVTRLNLSNLLESEIDWEKLENGIHGEEARKPKKKIYPHVFEVRDKVINYFNENERGRLIMACGTGKTLTSLKIAEKFTQNNGSILFLVPSIALIGQTLREWTSQSEGIINPICICSDPEITRNKVKIDQDTTKIIDLAFPASTNSEKILSQYQHYKKSGNNGMTVVFSTYQSIDVIARAQETLLKNGFPPFDLIICDEAHRTTGYTEAGMDDSSFVKVHNGEFIKSRKRLYMTATPKLYGSEATSQAAKQDIPLWSMDNEEYFGKEIHRIGFGEAVHKLQVLTDYKVIILTLNDKDVPPSVQKLLSNGESEIKVLDDLNKLIGTINALSKQFLGNENILEDGDDLPMKRAVAFCSSISNSNIISSTYNVASVNYLESLPEEKKKKMVTVHSQHMDGTMSAPQRDQMLSWLKEDTPGNECRIITNVRVLSEGVDVPSLDAVLFLSARNSQVDVVQSVGRVMRKAEGKKYGYIIIPVITPTDVEPEQALNDNERYKVVWTVLNALRAHDDRFNSTVNKIELNKKKPNQIIVGGADTHFDGDGNPIDKTYGPNDNGNPNDEIGRQLALQFEQFQDFVFARMVKKVGDRRYWEQWAKDVAILAERQIERIRYLIDTKKEQREFFDKFLEGLQKNINPSIDEEQAIEMLAQHIITQPIFDALFEGYSFVKSNAVSIAMQGMIENLETGSNLAEQDESLKKFYDSVRERATGINNSEGKQKIIIELYDKFFKTAFPKMVDKLGIVYTPVECVDFIIHSVNGILKKEFGRSISDENIHILDPFTGTGTFITRLLQSGLIQEKDLERKYLNEIHANEIVLLAYYIAAINIENAYHDATPDPDDGIGKANYTPFDGIVLTDTFQLGETDDAEKLFSEMFPKNSERVQRQKKAPLRVIIGNPPYSAGQKSREDNAQNQHYEKLENRIQTTYAKNTDSKNKNKLYDSYIKAFRWSTDRLDENGGIIGFVTNGGWLDNSAMSGFRLTLEQEFNKIYVLNLRGNALSAGEYRRKEGGNVFGEGTKTPVTMIFLLKNKVKEKCKIYYYDIGDYLSKKEKLNKISEFKNLTKLEFSELIPNESGDWINQRSDGFNGLIELENSLNGFFKFKSIGLQTTSADVYQFKKQNNDDEYIGLYRPFFKQYFIKNSATIYRPGKWDILSKGSNKFICITGKSGATDFSALISESYSDYQFQKNGQIFPFYFFEENNKTQKSLFDTDESQKYVRRDAISDFILERAKQQYGKSVTKEDIFYYVYGFLHSKEYRETFANDLKKMLPRLPLVEDVKDFWSFSKSGRALADLHLNYESVEPYPNVKVIGEDSDFFKVEKMRFPKKDQKDTIHFNSKITIQNIPLEAYEYVVNGKSAIEWIMERYQITTHTESQITNDPNDWAEEVGNPRYILDLLLSIINVSMKTRELVSNLPKVTFE